MADFFDLYLAFTKQTEQPVIYNRWAAISIASACIGRKAWLPFGHSRIFPNLYTMLIGDTGDRKSTAIITARKILAASGYDSIAPKKTTKEKFLLDLEGVLQDGEDPSLLQKGGKLDNVTALNLWGSETPTEPKEIFIAADEFNEFAGPSNMDFYSLLGDLWDWDDPETSYKQRVKNSRSVSIFQPTINILGGNTHDNFARCFPPEILGQGFLTRLLLIYGEPSGRKIPFPEAPPEALRVSVINHLQTLRSTFKGEIEIPAGPKEMLSSIYERWSQIDDVRFKGYSNRRYTQLLKLTLVFTACGNSGSITEECVIRANTVLAAAEHNMPRALGEFGKAKSSDVAHMVMDIIYKNKMPTTVKQLVASLYKDIQKRDQLIEILNTLTSAGKIQAVDKGRAYLPNKAPRRTQEFVDYSILTAEERAMIGDAC